MKSMIDIQTTICMHFLVKKKLRQMKTKQQTAFTPKTQIPIISNERSYNNLPYHEEHQQQQ